MPWPIARPTLPARSALLVSLALPAALSALPADPDPSPAEPSPVELSRSTPRETGAAAAGVNLFAERAAETGLDFVHVNGMTGELYFNEMMGSGLGLFDYDGDGDLDLYLVQGGSLAPAGADGQGRSPDHEAIDRLFRNDALAGRGESAPAGGAGAAWGSGDPPIAWVDVTEGAGLAVGGYGMGVATGDWDGDGRVDLYVTQWGAANRLLRNLGDGRFADATETSGTGDERWSVSATFADFDRDGRLDLYAGNYVRFRLEDPTRCTGPTGAAEYCGPLSYVPESDRLWRNLGDGRFADASATSGLQEIAAAALGVVATDLDGDGWTDLYVTVDQAPNLFWRNQGDGRFLEDALLSGSAVNWEGKAEASMGIEVADVDGDGDPDLFLTHLLTESHTLYLNDGRGVFTDATRRAGLETPSWPHTGFGTSSLDYDNDGRPDLFVANGAVRTIPALVDRGDPFPLHETNQLFRSTGDGFVETTAEAGAALALSEVSRGVATGDVDGDGDADLVVSNNNGPVRLLVNRIGTANRWLGVRLVGRRAADPLGARVAVDRGGAPPLERRVRTDGSYASASDPRLLFGLGAEGTATRLRVEWPSGASSEWADPPSGHYLVVYEP